MSIINDQPIIACDIDEILFPLYKSLGELEGSPSFGKITGGNDLKDWNSLYDICGGVGVAGEQFRLAGMYDSMKKHGPFEHAAAVLQRLSAAGAKIIIMSDRHPDTRESVVRWLADHSIPYDALYCEHLPNKVTLCKELGATAIVDDKPLTMCMAKAAGMIVTGRVTPYNYSCAQEHSIKLFDSWLHIERYLINQLGLVATV